MQNDRRDELWLCQSHIRFERISKNLDNPVFASPSNNPATKLPVPISIINTYSASAASDFLVAN
jgi:hypothetical protein